MSHSSHLTFVPFIVNQLGIRNMAEVGVLHGALSTAILDKCPQVKLYYLIDPWVPFMTPKRHSAKVWNRRYKKVKARMDRYGDRARILRLTSLEAAKQFKAESLDLGYLDANHAFKHLDEDIKTWWPKIRPKGYLAGHDMIDMWPGVLEAVEANFGKQYYCGQPSSNWDGVWIVRKDEARIKECEDS